jgi:hypothetical protein
LSGSALVSRSSASAIWPRPAYAAASITVGTAWSSTDSGPCAYASQRMPSSTSPMRSAIAPSRLVTRGPARSGPTARTQASSASRASSILPSMSATDPSVRSTSQFSGDNVRA